MIFKLLILSIFITKVIIANAATFTITNSNSCSTKTIYHTFSSKSIIHIASNYTYSKKGVHVQSGIVTKNFHKKIKLTNSHGTVQIIKTIAINRSKPPTIAEYLLTKNKFCVIKNKKKNCYNVTSKLTNSIQVVCNAKMVKFEKGDSTITEGHIDPSPKVVSPEEIKKGLANGAMPVNGRPM